MTTIDSPIKRVPHDRGGWIRLIAEYNVRPSKSMGQNFLFDHSVVERIVEVAEIAPGDRVIEVGPGLGILTAHLLSAGAWVDAIELDRQLAKHLRQLFSDFPHFQLHEADALKTDIEVLIESAPYHVVANLPYSIGSAVIMYMLEQPNAPQRMAVMVQKEVAERLVAGPPEMSILGVAAQALATTSLAFSVPPSSFIPAPNVDSEVVVLKPLGEQLLRRSNRPRFFKLVNAGFRHKRKQIINSLAFEVDLPKNEIAARLIRAGIDPLRRAQTLSVGEWLKLLDSWEIAERDT